MARETQRFWLTFDGDSSRKPLIYEMSRNFDVVFNFQPANLGKFHVPAGGAVAHVAKTVAAQHRAGMNDHTITQPNAGINRHVRIQFAISPQVRICTDYTTGADSRAVADSRVFSDDHALGYSNSVSQFRRSMYNCAGMDSRFRL